MDASAHPSRDGSVLGHIGLAWPDSPDLVVSVLAHLRHPVASKRPHQVLLGHRLHRSQSRVLDYIASRCLDWKWSHHPSGGHPSIIGARTPRRRSGRASRARAEATPRSSKEPAHGTGDARLIAPRRAAVRGGELPTCGAQAPATATTEEAQHGGALRRFCRLVEANATGVRETAPPLGGGGPSRRLAGGRCGRARDRRRGAGRGVVADAGRPADRSRDRRDNVLPRAAPACVLPPLVDTDSAPAHDRGVPTWLRCCTERHKGH